MGMVILNVPSSVKANNLAKSGSSCYTCPVIYTRRGRDSRSHLCDTGRDHKVTARDSYEFVNDTCWATIVERDNLSVVSIL
jgi:hypothetical protein